MFRGKEVKPIQSIDLLLLTFYLLMNILAFYFMAADKRKAEKGKWRIPERTLFLTAALGGALGMWLGMRIARHKTQHLSFLLMIPFFFLIHILLFYAYYYFRFMR